MMEIPNIQKLTNKYKDRDFRSNIYTKQKMGDKNK